eukprot:6175370-Pleurochrysis_carterae.AAC.1
MHLTLDGVLRNVLTEHVAKSDSVQKCCDVKKKSCKTHFELPGKGPRVTAGEEQRQLFNLHLRELDLGEQTLCASSALDMPTTLLLWLSALASRVICSWVEWTRRHAAKPLTHNLCSIHSVSILVAARPATVSGLHKMNWLVFRVATTF